MTEKINLIRERTPKRKGDDHQQNEEEGKWSILFRGLYIVFREAVKGMHGKTNLDTVSIESRPGGQTESEKKFPVQGSANLLLRRFELVLFAVTAKIYTSMHLRRSFPVT
jgi:hypothetical protein